MSIFPTAYFPPISYFARYIQAGSPQIEVCEHFVKQSIRTRCEILGHQGVQLLSIPVERPMGNKSLMKHVKVMNNGWESIHWKTIKTAYSSAPFFEHYGMEVHELLRAEKDLLCDFNERIFQRILSWIGIEKTSVFTHEYIENIPNDHRNTCFDTQSNWKHQPYTQVFREKQNCLYNLSILDLIFNEGPMTRQFVTEGKGIKAVE